MAPPAAAAALLLLLLALLLALLLSSPSAVPVPPPQRFPGPRAPAKAARVQPAGQPPRDDGRAGDGGGSNGCRPVPPQVSQRNNNYVE